MAGAHVGEQVCLVLEEVCLVYYRGRLTLEVGGCSMKDVGERSLTVREGKGRLRPFVRRRS